MENIDETMVRSIIRPRAKDAHKGDFGHALFVGGSYGRIGAAVLASRACLRTGVGLLTSYIPACGYNIMQTAVPEAMCLTDSHPNHISEMPDDIRPYSAIGAGPGLGMDPNTIFVLHSMMSLATCPLVLDADALNIIAECGRPEDIPENTILTPHPKEFQRLAGNYRNRNKQIEIAQEYSRRHKVIVVLKGAGTVVACPDGHAFINTTGNPWMATAGSGDALCGIILALLAQGYSPRESAVAGVYLHGLAGDRAASTGAPIIASDIIDSISIQI